MTRAVVVVAMALAVPVHATTWMAPQQPLREDEWLEYDASGADAMAIGVVVAVHDTIVDIAADGSGIPVRSLTLGITKWLKGATSDATIRVGLSPLDEQPVRGQDLHLLAGRDHAVLIMLARRGAGWVLCDGPDPQGSGMRLVPADAAVFERRVREAIARQQTERNRRQRPR